MAYPTEDCGVIIWRLRRLSGALLGAVALLLLLGRASSAQGSAGDTLEQGSSRGRGPEKGFPGYWPHQSADDGDFGVLPQYGPETNARGGKLKDVWGGDAPRPRPE